MSSAPLISPSSHPARRRLRLRLAAVAAVVVAIVGISAAPAGAAVLSSAAWGPAYVAYDANGCYFTAYLPSEQKVVAGTNNLYDGVEAQYLNGSTWVHGKWLAATATNWKIFTDSGWARTKYYTNIEWAGLKPSGLGISLPFVAQRRSGTWRLVAHAYWRSGTTVIATDNGVVLTMIYPGGGSGTTFGCY